jgi:hypothetical protein
MFHTDISMIRFGKSAKCAIPRNPFFSIDPIQGKYVAAVSATQEPSRLRLFAGGLQAQTHMAFRYTMSNIKAAIAEVCG